MAKKASSKKLHAAFTKHLKETEGQVARLGEVFELLGKKAVGKKCAAIEGIIEEAEEVMKEAEDDTIRDAAMVAAAQAKMLIQQLRQLESDGVVRRIVHHQVPPRVEYGLTDWGEALCPALDELLKWAASREDFSGASSAEA